MRLVVREILRRVDNVISKRASASPNQMLLSMFCVSYRWANSNLRIERMGIPRP